VFGPAGVWPVQLPGNATTPAIRSKETHGPLSPGWNLLLGEPEADGEVRHRARQSLIARKSTEGAGARIEPISQLPCNAFAIVHLDRWE